MKRSQKQGYHITILLIVCGVFVLITSMVIWSSREVRQNDSPSQVDSTGFTSAVNKFSVVLKKPSYGKIKENYNEVTFHTNEGDIRIIVNGTNFMNLRDYIANYDLKRNLIASDSTEIIIDEYEALSRIVEFPEEKITKKTYYIFVRNSVYILSTDSPELYGDLDQIARSFRYIP